MFRAGARHTHSARTSLDLELRGNPQRPGDSRSLKTVAAHNPISPFLTHFEKYATFQTSLAANADPSPRRTLAACAGNQRCSLQKQSFWAVVARQAGLAQRAHRHLRPEAPDLPQPGSRWRPRGRAQEAILAKGQALLRLRGSAQASAAAKSRPSSRNEQLPCWAAGG